MIPSFARVAAAVAMLALLPSWAYAQSAPPSNNPAAKPAPAAGNADDPVVAIVNGDKIRRSEIEVARQDLPAQYQSFPLEVVFGALVERVIDGRLLTVAGRKEGLAKDPEVRVRMSRLEDQVIQNVYLTRAIKAKLTETVLRQRYEEFVKENPPEQEIHVRHILLKTEDDAKAAIGELKGGAAFAEVAKKRSTDPSAENGGDLGFIKKGDVVPEFADAAFVLKTGEYSQMPVKTQFGYHVILVEESRMSSPPSFEEAKDEVEHEARRDTATEIVNGLRDKAKIVRFNLDGSPRKEGDTPPKDAGNKEE